MNRQTTSKCALASAALLTVTFALAGCGSGADAASASTNSSAAGTGTTGVSGELRILSYEQTLTPDTLDPFKQANPGLTVRAATFEDDDEAAAKIKAGFETDVIEVCLDEQGPLVDAGMLAPIDTSKLTYWNDLDPTFRDAEGVATNGDVTMVPIRAGAEGIIYDKATFPDGVDSWQALFDPKYDGQVALDGGYWLTAFAEVALANGNTDPFNLSDSELAAARDQLISQRSHFRAFARSEADKANLFKSGEIVLADGGPQSAEQLNADGGNVGWAAPKEGVLSWMCGLSISSKAKNVDAAYALLNDYTSPKTQGVIGSDYYVIMNPNGVQYVDDAHRENADPASIAGAHPETAPKNADLWRQYWQEVEVG